MAQDSASLDVTTVHRAATRQARLRVARERPDYPGDTRAATIWYRELMGERFPPPIANMDRASAVDVYQMRTARLSGSAQFLHEVGRNPSPSCQQCRNTDWEATRRPLRGEEADTPGTSCCVVQGPYSGRQRYAISYSGCQPNLSYANFYSG